VSERTPSGAAPARRDGLFDDPRSVSVIACIVAFIVILVGGHLYGRYLAAKDLGGRDAAIEQLVAQSQQQKRNIDEKSAQITNLQAQLDRVQAELETIMPTRNTFNLTPNQTLMVAGGRVSVGLVGSPANESIVLNVNGKQQTAAAGQVIAVGSDASANCQVTVQSFDMFKAVITAACAGAKGQ
jgi:hypothetical protein